MINLIEDLSILTDVSEPTLKKFIPVIGYCIGHALHEGICSRADITTIDLGIGELKLKVYSDGVRYKFVPSAALEKIIVSTIKNNSSPLLDKIDSNLQEKIDRAYKELI